MKKLATLTAAAAVMAMAGSAVYAQSNEATQDSPRQERIYKKGDWKQKRENMQRLAEARIAGIPAGLKLTADQQKLWQPVEEVIRANMKSRSETMTKMREARETSKDRPDYMERLEIRAEMAQQEAQNSKNLLDTMKPFWASLDDNQKNLLPPLLRPGQPGMKAGMRGGRGHHFGGSGMHGGMGMHSGMGWHDGNGPRGPRSN